MEFNVGDGIRNKMEELGDTPVAHSAFWHPIHGKTQETGYGATGKIYVWDDFGHAPRLVVMSYEDTSPVDLVESIDVSNHQERDLTHYIEMANATHVVVKLYQTIESAGGRAHAKAQIDSARLNGCTVGGYVWLYRSVDPVRQVRDALLLAEESNLPLPILWIDVEPYTDNSIPTVAQINTALAECEVQGVRGGIYSARWAWDILGNPSFPGVPLWIAEWDSVPELNVPPIGDMTLVGKQYTSTALDGSGLDRNVFLPEFTIAQ